MEIGVNKLKKLIKPTKHTKTVYIKGYSEGEDTVVITYAFRNQKDSHLTIPKETWSGMKFKTNEEDDKIEISNLNGLTIKTNESGWSRLVNEKEEADD